MKEFERDSNRIAHLRLAVEKIELFTSGISEENFCEDALIQSAVLFQFSILGEAILHINQEKLQKVNYPWHLVRGFRNLIAHEYHKIEISAVWAIIQNDIPTLKNKIIELSETF